MTDILNPHASELQGSTQIFELFEKQHEEMSNSLHDGLCQSLGSAILMTSLFEGETDEEAQPFREIGGLLRAALEDVSQLARQLHPSAGGLFDEEIRELTASASVNCLFSSEAVDFQVSPLVRLTLFRLMSFIVMEATREAFPQIDVRLSERQGRGVLVLTFRSQKSCEHWGSTPAWETLASFAGAEIAWGNSGVSERLVCTFPLMPSV